MLSRKVLIKSLCVNIFHLLQRMLTTYLGEFIKNYMQFSSSIYGYQFGVKMFIEGNQHIVATYW